MWLYLLACTKGGPGIGSDRGPALDTAEARDLSAWVETSGVIACADPQARAQGAFVEVTEAGDWDQRVGGAGAYGIATGDLDGDGWADIVISTVEGPQLFLSNGDWTYRDATHLLSSPTLQERSRAASMADFDADGDLDLFVGKLQGRDQLFRNDGAAGFVDVAEALGLGYGLRTMGSAWGDWDGDGDLDLVLANGAETEAAGLYERTEQGFVDAMHRVPDNAFRGPTFTAVFSDLDLDGDLDLYVVNDAGQPNRLLWNLGGRYAEDTADEAGLRLNICGMGVSIADLNDDEVPDLWVSDWERFWMMESVPALDLWADASLARGFDVDVEDRRMPWGVALADLDNDGDLDGLAGHGNLRANNYEMVVEQRASLFEQDDSGQFTEAGIAWGLGRLGKARGFSLADLDNDGFLDLVMSDLLDRPVLYRARCGEGAWLRVDLRQDGQNPRAVGARVQVVAGEQRWLRWVEAGGQAVGSGGPNAVHFGLGEHQEVDAIEVLWPDGVVDRYPGVDTRQRVVLTRPTGTGRRR